MPGAFTYSCQRFHIPSYLQNTDKLASKGVDLVVVIASNDAFVRIERILKLSNTLTKAILSSQVMSAWAKVNGVKGGDKILFMSDTKTFFSKNHGWDAGAGGRNGRWAMVIEKDGTISVADAEKSPAKVTV